MRHTARDTCRELSGRLQVPEIHPDAHPPRADEKQRRARPPPSPAPAAEPEGSAQLATSCLTGPAAQIGLFGFYYPQRELLLGYVHLFSFILYLLFI